VLLTAAAAELLLLSQAAIAPRSEAAAAVVPALRSKRRLDNSWALRVLSGLPNFAIFDPSRFPVLRN